MKKQFNYNWFDLESTINELQDLIANGYKFYVANSVEENGTDPQSGMPNSRLDYYAFDNKNEAGDFAANATANIFNPSQKSEVKYLDDLLKSSIKRKEERDVEAERRGRASQKQKDYNANLPQWRKIRTVAVRAKNNLTAITRQMEEAKKEYEAQLARLEQAMNEAGVEYGNIEDVLSKDFLK